MEIDKRQPIRFNKYASSAAGLQQDRFDGQLESHSVALPRFVLRLSKQRNHKLLPNKNSRSMQLALIAASSSAG
jgi:hypothetical protein